MDKLQKRIKDLQATLKKRVRCYNRIAKIAARVGKAARKAAKLSSKRRNL